jgi:hypothetical protein
VVHAAGHVVVDCVARDAQRCTDAQCGHGGQHPEHHRRAEEVSQPAGDRTGRALPGWLNDSLRPTRREKNFVPTIPNVIAANAGAKTEPATPVSACRIEIAKKRGNNRMARAPAVT